uniref:Regulator of microtubule dynamics protein 3 n=1 Tax=Geotrypetes seraphini TaxID=260995 RepID=A0A6P8RRL4_GEOSA|nr:regulator of microtubule dynamics protein 3 [Geotrypetes seraphini]XP_033808179.1 regulator of microtubule dynamics protein 3 [Geotrypetes seraphini]XP_033808180.1 regulator of microtubule dynamics protein 3 [Geotrypetes seraphini]XP_033808182.1 regulator of microtubule dynamics protein 3 [Geotrypetes seraphini]XP_033808183.1 regulator of microtubule dynamics protein 3 [Geotrypetes seraphini]XP_033808184.1 regulator of microtubule dynamics protein 3 [Geotrypetes seraphini]XP_033808185.1 re
MSKLQILGFGLVLGTATGIGLFYVFYKRPWNRKEKKGKHRTGNGYQSQNSVGHLECTQVAQNLHQVSWEGPQLNEADGIIWTLASSENRELEAPYNLDRVLHSINELREQVENLRTTIQGLSAEIIGEVKCHLEESQKVPRRKRYLLSRERSESTGSSSIYFSANTGLIQTDAESEGGYTTANAESDYDRESYKESEEEDEVSSETVKLARRDSLDLGVEDEGTLSFEPVSEEEFANLLRQADQLHDGDKKEKVVGFQLLHRNKLLYDRSDFLWRLARSYSDMCEITEHAEEKKCYALEGKEVAETVLKKDDSSAECHQWFAVLSGQLSDHESIQKRIHTGYAFKEHIEKAISLKPNDAKSYYLLGRWCYQIANLGWLERKTASALFETPPMATICDALQNFLKAEQLSPGFSLATRVYLAKCYKNLEDESAAAKWLNLASELPVKSNEDSECQRELEEMLAEFSERSSFSA